MSDQRADMKLAGVQQLLSVMEALRDPVTGCPWDQKQTFESIVPHTIEEAYEVADAIFRNHTQDIKEELGDLLFQVVFYGQLAKENGDYQFDDIAQGMADKLIRRHPHVFGDAIGESSDEDLNAQWDAIKKQEKAARKHVPSDGILSDIPLGMAPLIRANKIQKTCAKVGFDWPSVEPVVEKIQEEIAEVINAHKTTPRNADHVEEEVGDLLFAVVNLSRHLNVNPEIALQQANQKFERRFSSMERLATERQIEFSTLPLLEQERLWQAVKSQEKE